MSALTNNLTDRWQTLSTRERWLLAVLAVIFVLGLFYWGLFKPLDERMQQAKNNLSTEKELHAWVTQSANRISTYRLNNNGGSSNLPLNQLVSSSATSHQVSMVRTQPRDDSLQVWTQPMAFQVMIRWFSALREQGVYVQMLDIERTQTPGVVEVKRLQFFKPE